MLAYGNGVNGECFAHLICKIRPQTPTKPTLLLVMLQLGYRSPHGLLLPYIQDTFQFRKLAGVTGSPNPKRINRGPTDVPRQSLYKTSLPPPALF